MIDINPPPSLLQAAHSNVSSNSFSFLQRMFEDYLELSLIRLTKGWKEDKKRKRIICGTVEYGAIIFR